MFSPSVVSLKHFYASPLGEAARQLISQTITEFWPAVGSDSVLGIGYTTPYLERFLQAGMPVAACMPAQQGAAYWPPSRGNLTLLADESDLPLRENSFNRVLLAHSVENCDHLSWMLEEVWRVLTPGGRVLVMVPNRMGFWSRSSKSPFGYGRPFNLTQVRDLLSEHNFTVSGSRPALFTPPTDLQILWRVAPRIEAFGRFICPFLGGVWLVEAEKQVYASIKQPAKARLRYRMVATRPAMSSGRQGL